MPMAGVWHDICFRVLVYRESRIQDHTYNSYGWVLQQGRWFLIMQLWLANVGIANLMSLRELS